MRLQIFVQTGTLTHGAKFVLKVSPSRDHSVDRTTIVIRLWPGLGSTAGPNLDGKLVPSAQTEGVSRSSIVRGQLS
jgi:hypothetical protein